MTFNTFLCILLGAFFLAATVTTSSALKISNRESTLLRHTQHLTLGRLHRHYIAIKSQLTDDQALLHVKTIVEENPDATEAEIVAFLRLCGMSMSRIHNIHAKLKEAEKNTKKNPHSQGEKQHIIAKQIALMKKTQPDLNPKISIALGKALGGSKQTVQKAVAESEEILESSQIDKEFGDDKEGDKKAHIMKLVIIIHKVNPSVDEEEAMNYFLL